jgi:hypothetical protein
MLRRPTRTALHSALSALAGGLRGTAMQREQDQMRAERTANTQRQGLLDSLSLADRGAVRVPPPMADAPESVVPMPSAPPPELGMPVTFNNEQYIVPSLAERQRRDAMRARDLSEEMREPENRRAYGALRTIDPQFAAEYDPQVDYAAVVRSRTGVRDANTYAVDDRRDAREAEQAAKRAKAKAWFNSIYPRLDVRDPERNRIGQLYAEVASTMAEGSHPDDIFVAMMEAEQARLSQESLGALGDQRATAAERLRVEYGLGGGTGGGGTLPPPPGMGAPSPFPAQPVTPRPQAPAPRAPTPQATTVPGVIPPAPAWFDEAEIGMSWADFYRANTGQRNP